MSTVVKDTMHIVLLIMIHVYRPTDIGSTQKFHPKITWFILAYCGGDIGITFWRT